MSEKYFLVQNYLLDLAKKNLEIIVIVFFSLGNMMNKMILENYIQNDISRSELPEISRIKHTIIITVSR